jgi:hypothetical protein
MMIPIEMVVPVVIVSVITVIMCIGAIIMRRANLPATGYPHTAGPITRHPHVPRTRVGHRHHGRCDHHRLRRTNHWRGWRYHARRRGRHGHDRDRRNREVEPKAEVNSSTSRQRCRADKGGQEKHFNFHNFICLFFYHWSRSLPRLPLANTGLLAPSCRKKRELGGFIASVL